jgi:hypothetical protein
MDRGLTIPEIWNLNRVINDEIEDYVTFLKVTVIDAERFPNSSPINDNIESFKSQLLDCQNQLAESKQRLINIRSIPYSTKTFNLWTNTRLHIEHIIKILDVRIYWLNNTITKLSKFL